MEIVVAAALGVMCLAYLFRHEVDSSEAKEKSVREKYVEALEEAKDMEILNTKLLVQSAIDNGNYSINTTGIHLTVDNVKKMLAESFPDLYFSVKMSRDCCSEVVNNITITITKPLVP